MKLFVKAQRFTFLLFVITILPIVTIFGQTRKDKRAFQDAQEYIRVAEYHHALEILSDLSTRFPDNPNYNYYLGVSYLHSALKQDALEHFLITKKKLGPDFKKLKYYLAKSYHLHHQFDEAISYYQEYLETFTEEDPYDKELDLSKKEIEHRIQQCKVGKELVKSPEEVEIFNLGSNINSKYSDMTPVITADERIMIFTSRRENEKGETPIDPMTNTPYENIYIAIKNQKGQWSKPYNIGSEINTSDSHDAAIGLSPDGSELYIYRSTNTDEVLSGDIYYSDYIKNKWTPPTRYPDGINSRNWETHASITADKETLFFVSNRSNDGAIGGTDIYMVKKLPNGEWAKPKNLGPTINTEFDEESPFISPDGKVLYFSSQGHRSMGGFDIFTSFFDSETGQWSTPKNIGFPINTADDDMFFVWSSDGSRGYFSSVREDSNGEEDIYMVSAPGRNLKDIVVNGLIRDNNTQEVLAANIEITNLNSKSSNSAVQNVNTTGGYTLYLEPGNDYGVRVGTDGYLFKSFKVNVDEQFDFLQIAQNFELQPLTNNKKEILYNIKVDENNEVTQESMQELQYLKKFIEDNPDFNFQIAVHSDNSEDSVVSAFRTQAQAEAVVHLLQDMGIEEERLNAKGYGATYPIATNKTNSGKQQNNRVEYIVTEQGKEVNYEELAIKPELIEELVEAVECPTLQDGYVFEDKVYFHPSDDNLSPESMEVIEKLSTILDFCPEFQLEIGGHTDNRGSVEYRKLLAKKHASLVTQQLVYRGVEKDRLIIRSYSDSLNVSDNDSEESRAKNRRIEFKMIVPTPEEIDPNTLTASTKEGAIINEEPTNTNAQFYPSGLPMPALEGLFKNGTRLKDAVLFGFDASSIDANQQVKINRVISKLKKEKNLIIQIQGFTDSSGPATYNLFLAEQRTKTVKQALIEGGIDTKRVYILSYGEDYPAQENDSYSGRKGNRRAEFVIAEK